MKQLIQPLFNRKDGDDFTLLSFLYVSTLSKVLAHESPENG